jgi:hypothetical protein
MSLYFYLLLICLSILSFQVFSSLAVMVENTSEYHIDFLHAPLIYYGFVLGAIYSVYAFYFAFRKIELTVLSLYEKEDNKNGGARYRNVL